MNPLAQWTNVDAYLADALVQSDPALERVLEASAAAGLPAINVSPLQGKLLHLLARISGARVMLEIGTLAGYSTLWLARALPPDGKIVTLELEAGHAAIARANFARAGVSDRIEVRVGPAAETLAGLAEEKGGPFDLVFIDADKASTAEYFTWALKLSRRGTVIVVDNVVRNGAVTDASSLDPNIQGVRRFMAMLAGEARVSATAIQTVGSKGYDGFAVAMVTAG